MEMAFSTIVSGGKIQDFNLLKFQLIVTYCWKNLERGYLVLFLFRSVGDIVCIPLQGGMERTRRGDAGGRGEFLFFWRDWLG